MLTCCSHFHVRHTTLDMMEHNHLGVMFYVKNKHVLCLFVNTIYY